MAELHLLPNCPTTSTVFTHCFKQRTMKTTWTLISLLPQWSKLFSEWFKDTVHPVINAIGAMEAGTVQFSFRHYKQLGIV